MKKTSASFVIVSAAIMLAGCETPKPGTESAERGPGGTIAYMVPVETSEPGARIEANGEDIGKSPVTLKIFGDKDGTFHNFGSYEYVIKAYPVRPGQSVQTKVFHTGGWFMPEDKIPSKIYFDMSLNPATQTIDGNVNK